MRNPLILVAAGVALLLAVVVGDRLARHHMHTVTTVTITTPSHPTTTAPPATTTTPAPPPVLPPVPMSWDNAGALVSHPGDADPTWLGHVMRANGFGWVALFLGNASDMSPPDTGWIARFRLASGLPVGGWSVLGDDPSGEATDAVRLIEQDGLSFYIADAEAGYGYTEADATSGMRYRRSGRFVAAFRAAEPTLPAAVSSYCRPDEHDLDWSAWAKAGFAFLPQAYVNDFGPSVAPAECVLGAAPFFPKSQVHPTVPSYAGQFGDAPDRLTQLLAQAGTTGFSIYPAEVGLSEQDWQVYGRAIASLRLAASPGSAP